MEIKSILIKDTTREERIQIVADMVAQANEYGYDQCVEFQENEVTLRAAAEDAARAGEVVE